MLKQVIAFFVQMALRSRYKIRGNFPIGTVKASGTLILPNHPAEVDPIILCSFLWSRYSPRPVVLETVFQMPVLSSVFRILRAFAMPDMEQGSGAYKRRRISQTLDAIVTALESGENVMIYPSGRLTLDGRETLGGASGTYTILQRLESGSVLLLRTKGLWGSRFSKSHTQGQRPNIGKAFLSSAGLVLKNLFFFAPKRAVSVQYEEIPLETLKAMDLRTLNTFLENWYNIDGTEPLNLVREAFYSDAKPLIPAAVQHDTDEPEIDEATRTKVLTHLALLSKRPLAAITAGQRLGDDLGLDSLTVAELVSWLHDELEVGDVELAQLVNVASVLKAAVPIGASPAATHQSLPTPSAWLANIKTRPAPALYSRASLPIAFIECVAKLGAHAACADARLGVKSYRQILTASLVLADQWKAFPEQRIAVLMPASGMTTLVSMSLLLAGKVPVFLNWTAGSRHLTHALETAQVQRIITAGAVLDRLNVDLSAFEERFIYLEELSQSIGAVTKLRCLFSSYLSPSTLIRSLDLHERSENEPAVILFTSGSEAAPKAVPLSHKNILSNIDSATKIFEFESSDVLFGFLPPFHSFGLTVTTFLPLVCGLRVAFHSNPNESRNIASLCKTWAVSLMAGTPAFLKGVLVAGSSEQFAQLRLLVSGADKLPDDLRQLCSERAPKAMLLEGYGITECSPVVAAQRPNSNDRGVGSPLPGVELKVVDIDSHQPLPEGERGLILIAGDNVFNGYLHSSQSPFIELENKRWYNSGDLGYLDQGSLILAGRLKRFVKIGGEMISLPAIEDALQKHFESIDGSKPLELAIIDRLDMQSHKPLLFLFINRETISIEDVQKALKEAGFPAIVRIAEVRNLPNLPLLGSGKIDVQSLKMLLQDEATSDVQPAAKSPQEAQLS